MIVNCGSCGSRFRLDEALLKGAKGARIRCRSCGSGIVLLKDPGGPGDAASQKIPRVEDLFLPPPDPAEARSFLAAGATRNPAVSRRFLLPAIVLVFLALAVAISFRRPASVARIPAPPPVARVAGAAAYEIRDVEGRWSLRQDDRSIYVIRGTVVNVGKIPSQGIRIRAALLGTDNRSIAEGGAFAGNMIDETLLPHMETVRVEAFLGLRYGERNTNRDIPAGGSLPFMVVFFDPPAPVGSFSVRAVDADGEVKPLVYDNESPGERNPVAMTLPAN